MLRLRAELVDAFRRLDTCTVSNAIETFDVRLRNEGFADSTIRGLFDDLPPVMGHAVTARIRTAVPPPVGHNYHDRTDWWNYILTVPAPRIVVVEDVDERPGVGAFVGEVHASILRALGCVGLRDQRRRARPASASARIGFQFFAPHVATSHAFAHIVEFGATGDGRRAGRRFGGHRLRRSPRCLTVPRDIAGRIPDGGGPDVEGRAPMSSSCASRPTFPSSVFVRS